MTTKIDIPVSVSLVFNSKYLKVMPKAVEWNRRVYKIEKIGFHHTFRQGHILHHVFSVVSKSVFFRLVLNTENLHWRLEEVSDGLPS